MTDDKRLEQITRLVEDTFGLWNYKRMGFSWESYYLNHTLRVKNLGVNMAVVEGADARLMEYAGILHDITKRYDGKILKTDDGKNVVNEQGFWLNEMVAPNAGENWVTQLYHELNLWGMVHHESGAVLTERILAKFGVPDGERQLIAKIVRGHLKASNLSPDDFDDLYREPEVRLLYDADTIDPNLGMTAFYRNIQIHMGGVHARGEEPDVKAYVERLPKWVAMKESFIGHMLSETGKDVAVERYRRNVEITDALQAELNDFDLNAQYGMIGAVRFLKTDAESPSMHRHVSQLRAEWLPARERELENETTFSRDAAREALERARDLTALMEREIDGKV
jgi:hypothetical protein